MNWRLLTSVRRRGGGGVILIRLDELVFVCRNEFALSLKWRIKGEKEMVPTINREKATSSDQYVKPPPH